MLGEGREREREREIEMGKKNFFQSLKQTHFTALILNWHIYLTITMDGMNCSELRKVQQWHVCTILVSMLPHRLFSVFVSCMLPPIPQKDSIKLKTTSFPLPKMTCWTKNQISPNANFSSGFASLPPPSLPTPHNFFPPDSFDSFAFGNENAKGNPKETPPPKKKKEDSCGPYLQTYVQYQ